jgi:hypothetical protein
LNQYFYNYIANVRKNWGNHLGLVEFCYNFTKHLAIKTNPVKLALGIETKQPMDLAIFRTKSTHREGGKEAETMVKEREERKSRANKLRRHIELKVGDLVWLNIMDFKMPKTLVNRFVPKYASLYRSFVNPTWMRIRCNYQQRP